VLSGLDNSGTLSVYCRLIDPDSIRLIATISQNTINRSNMEFSGGSRLLAQFGNQKAVNDEETNIHFIGKRLK
jgi:hypothetical protein